MLDHGRCGIDTGGKPTALAELSGTGPMALQAQRLQVCKIAFATSLHYRDDMIGIPQALAAAHLPLSESGYAGSAPQTFYATKFCETIDLANRADTPVTLQYPFALVTRTAAELPFFDTPGGAKSGAPGGDFQIAPAAKSTAALPFRQRGTIHPATRHCTPRTHFNRIQIWVLEQRRVL